MYRVSAIDHRRIRTPISQRTYRSRLPGVPPCDIGSNNRPLQYRCYSEINITKACEAVKEGLSYRRAEREFGVPSSTLHDHVSGRVFLGAHSGPSKYLSDNEEKELANFLIGCSRIGYARTRKQVIALVEAILIETRGTPVVLSNGWWSGFSKRHPELTVRSAEKLAYCRAVATDQKVMDAYFELLEETLHENNLLSSPGQIFNVDESGFPLEPKPETVVAEKGCKHPFVQTSGNKSQITVLTCVSAAGVAVPPMVIYDRAVLRQDLTEGEVPSTIYGLTNNGWSNSEMFDTWFNNQFLHFAPAARPILLLMDGHSSHFNPMTVRKAVEENIILFCLPPHTTHLVQPLDRSVFGVLKQCWREECQDYITRNPGRVVSKFQFSTLFSAAWYRAMTVKNIVAGFKVTGVYPFNPKAVVIQDIDSGDKTAESSRIAYIPLFSPPKGRRSRLDFSTLDSLSLSLTPPQSSAYLPGSPSPSPAHSPSDLHKDTVYTFPKTSTLSKFLTYPCRPSKRKPPKKIASAKVLTSAENLKMLEEKEEMKLEKERAKEQHKQERERKAKEREKRKMELEIEKEKRKQEKEDQAKKKEELRKASTLKTVPVTVSGSRTGRGRIARSSTSIMFTDEEEKLFSRRLENGYDLGDPKYLQWLQIFHPSESEKIVTNPLPPMHRDSVPSSVGKSVPKSGTCASIDPNSSGTTDRHKYPTCSSVKALPARGKTAQKKLPTKKQEVTSGRLIDSSIYLYMCY